MANLCFIEVRIKISRLETIYGWSRCCSHATAILTDTFKNTSLNYRMQEHINTEENVITETT